MVAAEFQALLDAAVDAIVVIDIQGSIITFNRAAERMFGYGAADVLGTNVGILMSQPNGSEHNQYLARYVETYGEEPPAPFHANGYDAVKLWRRWRKEALTP